MYQDFAQQVENTARAVVNDIHTALPGKIVSFDSGKCTAVVQPKGKYLTADGESLNYPMISDVPAVFPYCRSCNAGMIFPVKPDDDCLIIISETELDEWRSGAASEAPLRYDLTSAMTVPGLMREGGETVRKAVERNAAVIVSGTAEIIVANGKIDMTGEMIVHGNVSVDGTLTAGGINLNAHRHTSAIAGQKTGRPEN